MRQRKDVKNNVLFRTEPQSNKQSYHRAGISKTYNINRRIKDCPRYIRFNVNYTDEYGIQRVKCFHVGREGQFTDEKLAEVEAAANSFRDDFEKRLAKEARRRAKAAAYNEAHKFDKYRKH